MTALYLPAVLIYLAGLAALAGWRSKLVRTGDDFLLAGRTLPARVLLLTLLSTWIGSGSLFAGAGLGYRAGFPALWQPAGAWAGIALIYFIAPRIRRVAGYTVADILETRFGPPARVLGTLVTVIAYTAIAAYQFRAGGRLLHLMSGMDPVTGTLITAAFCIAFTALAGMLSVAWLDIANGLMMSVGIGVAAVFLAGRGGGITESLAALRPDQLTLLGSLSPVAALALFLPTMLLLLGEATMYQKFFAAASDAAVRRAVVGWFAATILVEGLIVVLGVLGSTLVPGLTPDASEAIVVRVALDVLPALFAILLLCGAAAIVVSTASSMLLAAATCAATETCRRFATVSSGDRQVVRCARLGVVGLGVLGIVGGALFPSILAIALWAYTMYGAGITPALLAALLWPRATRRAGVASIGAGMVTTLVWEAIGLARGPAGDPSYLLGVQTVYPAVVLSVGTLVSLSLTSPPDMKQ